MFFFFNIKSTCICAAWLFTAAFPFQAVTERPPGVICRVQGPTPTGTQNYHPGPNHPGLQPPGSFHQRHHGFDQRAFPPGREVQGKFVSFFFFNVIQLLAIRSETKGGVVYLRAAILGH